MNATATPKEKRIDRSGFWHIAIMLGYCGTPFRGLQLQCGPNHGGMHETVEGCLLLALGKLSLVPIRDDRAPKELKMLRACRTDKGVHAVRNVVSMFINPKDLRAVGELDQQEKGDVDATNQAPPPHVEGAVFDEDPNGSTSQEQNVKDASMLERVRAKLHLALQEVLKEHNIPESSIVPHDLFRVAPHFCPRKYCRSRTYQYLLPVYALFPQCDSWDTFESKVLPQLKLNATAQEESLPPHPVVNGDVDGSSSVKMRRFEFNGKKGVGEEDGLCLATQCAAFDALLSETFVGTKRWHNFTDDTDPSRMVHPSETRSVRSIWRMNVAPFLVTSSSSIESNNVEPTARYYVIVQLQGNSFLLHMIRKIMGTALAAFRGTCRRALATDALDETKRVTTPMAPGEFLLLNHSSFYVYDRTVMPKRTTTVGEDGTVEEEPPLPTVPNMSVRFPTFTERHYKTESVVTEYICAQIYAAIVASDKEQEQQGTTLKKPAPMTLFLRMSKMHNWSIKPIKDGSKAGSAGKNKKRNRKGGQKRNDDDDEDGSDVEPAAEDTASLPVCVQHAFGGSWLE